MRTNLGSKDSDWETSHLARSSFTITLSHLQSSSHLVLLCWPRINTPRLSDFTLQHADSEGALLGERCPLQAASGVSALASGLDQPQALSQCSQDPSPRQDSQEQLRPVDTDTKAGSSPSEGGMEPEEGDSYKEDVLLEDDQVADFASSVLAAISCWQNKARALLSTHFTTVRVSDTHSFLTSCTPSPPEHILRRSLSTRDLIISTLVSNTNRTF